MNNITKKPKPAIQRTDHRERTLRVKKTRSLESRKNKSQIRLLLIITISLAILGSLLFFFLKGRSNDGPKIKAGWYQYQAKNSHFSVQLPTSVILEPNLDEKQNLYICNYNDRSFLIIFSKYKFIDGWQATYSKESSTALLDFILEKAMQIAEGDIISKTYLDHQGYAAVDITAKFKYSGYGRMRTIITPKGSYSLGVSSSKEAIMKDPLTTQFIESFTYQ